MKSEVVRCTACGWRSDGKIHSKCNFAQKCIRFFKIGLFVWVAGVVEPGNAQAGLLDDSDAEGVRSLLLLSGVAVAGYHRDFDGLQQFGSSVLLTSGITLAAKALVDSERPNGEDNDSFPSGHVATAFAGAGFLHRRYGLKFGIPAYLAATSVALNRLENDHHRVVDVAAGGLIALFVNQYLVTPGPTIQVRFSATNLSVGLRFNY